MAWPSTTVTANVDQGVDSPTLARTQILENVQAVNSIIDEFGTVNANPAIAGSMLVYDGSQWGLITTAEKSAYVLLQHNATTSVSATSGTQGVEFDIPDTPISSGNERHDPNGYVTVSSSNFTLVAGTYDINISGFGFVLQNDASDNGSAPSSDITIENLTVKLINTSDSTTVKTYTPVLNELQQIDTSVSPIDTVFFNTTLNTRVTLASSKNFVLRINYDVTWASDTSPTTTTSTGLCRGQYMMDIRDAG
jgi:hypothetical protein